MSGPARVYAIGDVHGHLAKLRGVHERIEVDLRDRPVSSHRIVHIGDYVDRGPNSSGVLEYLVRGEDAGEPWINLLGNHDRMFLRYLIAPRGEDHHLPSDLWWLHERLGGITTLRSYGLTIPDGATAERGVAIHREARAAVPALHFAFLAGLRRFWFWRGFFFTHAGVRPGIPLRDQEEDDLIWIRKGFLDSDADFGATVIHGHTVVSEVEDHGNRIAIDTGAGRDGPLSCIVVEGESGAVRLLGGEVLR